MSMLDLYGIKEVADVVFWNLDDAGNKTSPALYLDTLKVSTIEETAEQTEARGGKGNPPLIIWDYGKEITLTLEDALFSMKSMSIMHSQDLEIDTSVTSVTRGGKVRTFLDANSSVSYKLPKDADGATVEFFDETGASVTAGNLSADQIYLIKYDKAVEGAASIEVSSENFPGTYAITGDTYARSQANGKDEFFQFEIPLAKVNPEQTFTMQAEGDPSTFSMTVRVMRPDDGVMMKLTKYPKAD